MRSISIQIQPARSATLDITAVSAILSEIAKDGALVLRHAFDQGEDRGPYYNFTFGTERAPELWREIRRRLFEDPILGDTVRTSAMAMCSSEDGWDDYLLLFHFDPSVKTDVAPEFAH